MKNVILFFVLLFVLAGIKAQVKSDNGGINFPSDNVIPPSPNATSLSRFGQYPVDYSTGLPQIAIPLYTISTPQLTLPISLSYHASGVRVDEIPGWAGLSWTLQAGGVISVTVQGLPDFSSNKTMMTSADFDRMASSDAVAPLSEISLGLADVGYDIYSYNVPGKISGTFTYSKSGALVELPRTNNKIIKTVDGFTIVADDGVTYVFNGLEKSSSSIEYVSAYYLTKIISADKQDEITLRYIKTPERYSDNFISTCLWKGSDCSDAEIEMSTLTPYPLMHLTENYPNVSSSVGYDELLLSEITFTGGKIIFESEGGRLDKRKYRIKNIQIIQDESNKILQKISFEHSYFEAYGDDKRLRLDAVEIAGNGQEKSRYQLYYNKVMLPGYFNFYNAINGYFGQDKWGYFNGVMTNEHFIGADFDAADLWRKPSNRAPSEYFRKAASLEKIVYPTGGYTIFQMESNKDKQGDIYGGLRIRQITSYGNDCKLLETKQYEYVSEGPQLPSDDINNYQYYTYTQAYQRYVPANSHNQFGYVQSTKKFYVSTPIIPFGLQGSPQILYSKVTEYSKVGSDDNGKTEFIYDCTPNDYYYTPQTPTMMGTLPRYKRYVKDKVWQRGQLLEERIYKKNQAGYELIRRTINEYNAIEDKDAIIGTTVNNGIIVTNLSTAKENFWWFDIKVSTGYKKLSKTSTVDYVNGQEALVSSTLFNYDKSNSPANSHLFVTSASSSNSKGEELSTRYKYPPDLLVSGNSQDALVIKAMCDANMISSPVEQVNYVRKNGDGYKAVKGSLLRYNFFNGQIKPWQILNLETTAPFLYDGIVLDGTTGFALNDKYKLKTTFSLYNTKGRLLEAISSNGITKSYIWGYKYNYPIAKVEGASYSQLKIAMGKQNENDDLASITTMSTPQLSVVLSDLRNNLKQVAPQAQLSSFSFDYLVGCLSETGPNGISQSYLYDGMGRLSAIKDNTGAIVKAYSYNYAGSLNNCAENSDNTGAYYNDEKSGVFTKNDCTAGSAGVQYFYFVKEKTYISTISKEDANNMAIAEINKYGQQFANLYGACQTPGMVTLKYSNSTNYTATLQMTNAAGGSYLFDLPPTQGRRVDVAEIKEGVYTGSITTSSPNACNFAVYYQTANGVKSMYFSNINFCASCAIISIN
ncbi:MAG: hypothetical protein J0I41_21060 [Filimonas sp.]|nr:hypothetical protein [Filimonas sp.]